MPTILGQTILTLADWSKRVGPAGGIDTIAELLSQLNEINEDMLWMESNLPTGHRTTLRTSLPSATWRQLNAGVVPGKSTTAQIEDRCAILETWTEVDKDLAELNGDVNAFRLTEALGNMEAMNQAFAQTLFYGDDTTAKEKFLGLAPRFGAIAGAGNATNIIDAGGTGSVNTSIWLIAWGPMTVFGIFPKGSRAGLYHADLGLETIENTAGIGGSRMRGYRDQWQWKCGLCVRDWRYIVRICNIDVTNLVNETSAAPLIKLMIRAMHRLPTMGMGKLAFYMNRTIREMLDIQALEAALYQLKIDNVDGKLITSFRAVPLRTCDQILVTEARVV